MFVHDPVPADRAESFAVCLAGESFKWQWTHEPTVKKREPLVTDHTIAREKLSETLKVRTSPLPVPRATCAADLRQLPSGDERGIGHQCFVVRTCSLRSFRPKYVADRTVCLPAIGDAVLPRFAGLIHQRPFLRAPGMRRREPFSVRLPRGPHLLVSHDPASGVSARALSRRMGDYASQSAEAESVIKRRAADRR